MWHSVFLHRQNISYMLLGFLWVMFSCSYKMLNVWSQPSYRCKLTWHTYHISRRLTNNYQGFSKMLQVLTGLGPVHIHNLLASMNEHFQGQGGLARHAWQCRHYRTHAGYEAGGPGWSEAGCRESCICWSGKRRLEKFVASLPLLGISELCLGSVGDLLNLFGSTFNTTFFMPMLLVKTCCNSWVEDML